MSLRLTAVTQLHSVIPCASSTRSNHSALSPKPDQAHAETIRDHISNDFGRRAKVLGSEPSRTEFVSYGLGFALSRQQGTVF